jgi:hypothetical protein
MHGMPTSNRLTALPPSLREQPVADAGVPRLELNEWAARYGVVAGITTREHGFGLGLASEEAVGQVMTHWRKFRASFEERFSGVVLSHQVHGTAVRWHERRADGWLILDGADGHATATAGVLLTITVADCVPVYLAAPKRGALALLHAGWRGAAAGILERGVALLERHALVAAGDIVMHCGVGICGACYEVGPDVATRFTGRPETGRSHLDLREILAQQAQLLGIAQATLSPWCSAHDRERFFSHRASGGRDGRMVAYLGRPVA